VSAVALGKFDIEDEDGERTSPAEGEELDLDALVRKLAPPGADFAPACGEHDRCYATWRRERSPHEHRAACDRELLTNLEYACAAAVERQSSAARALDTRSMASCLTVAHLAMRVAYETGAGGYDSVQRTVINSTVRETNAAHVFSQVRAPKNAGELCDVVEVTC